MGLGVPQAAGVGADLVSQHDGSVGHLAEFQLEVHQRHAALGPERLQHLVDSEGIVLDGLDLLCRGQFQCQRVIGVQQRIAQRVILIGKLDGGLIEHDALLHAVALGEGTGGDIADNDLQRDDGNPLHQRFPLAQLLDKMGGDAGLFHFGHQAVGHLVVDDALSEDGAFFQAVERGGIILVIHDEQLGIIGFEYFFCFALVDLF